MNEYKKVYISAPISGHDLTERHEAFAKWALEVACEGYVAVNPMMNDLPDEAPYTEHMKADIRMLLDCDAMVAPVRWRCSKGCTLEARVAELCGIPVIGRIDDNGRINWLVETPAEEKRNRII